MSGLPPVNSDEEQTFREGSPASAADAIEELGMWQKEAGAERAADPRRAARLLHEAAHIHETRLGQTREAAKTYAQSVSLDPTFAPNAWALHRIFSAKGFWDNLVRLADAEIRFSALPRDRDRADLYVEKGRILEDRLGRLDEAAACYEAALALCPDHCGALMALLLLAGRRDVPTQTEDALARLMVHFPDPGFRAAAALELSRRLAIPATPDNATTPEQIVAAADALLRALAAGASAGPLFAELDRLCTLLPERTDLRLRVLDGFDSWMSRNGGLELAGEAPGRYREKAAILFQRGAKDAALKVLERALELAPGHPQLFQDFLNGAEDLGRTDAIARLAENSAGIVPEPMLDEALLRQAEVAARSGALGEAVGVLDRLAGSGRLAPLVFPVRCHVLSRLGDAEGLARAFAAEAGRLEETSPGEAAQLATRAGLIRYELVKDLLGAEESFRRALVAAPGFPAAAAGLKAVLAQGGHWQALAECLEAELARSSGAGAGELRRQAVVVWRDLVGDARKALPHQQALLVERGGEPEDQIDFVDLAGSVVLADPDSREAAGAAARSLDRLARDAATPEARAPLRVLAARILALTGDEARSEVLFAQGFADDPCSWTAASLEQIFARTGRSGERVETLTHEMQEAGRRSLSGEALSLRYRIAFLAASEERLADALDVLADLRSRYDPIAGAWSWDLARQLGNVERQIAVLSDLREAARTRGDVNDIFATTLALAQAVQTSGPRAKASDLFDAAWSALPSPGADGAVDAALGALCCRLSAGDAAGEVAGLRRLAIALHARHASWASRVDEEAELAAVAAGVPGEVRNGPETPGSLVLAWVGALRSGDAPGSLAALERIAQEAHAPELGVAVAVQRFLLGEAGAADDLARAAGNSSAPAIEILASELPLASADALAAFRTSRAQRLGLSGRAEDCELAEILFIEEAQGAEVSGHLKRAADAWVKVLELAPESLRATQGLQRVFSAAGDRRGEAHVLARMAALLPGAPDAAEAFFKAAALWQAEGNADAAGALLVKALNKMPENGKVYDRLIALLEARQDTSAQEKLIAFKLRHTASESARAALLTRRDALRTSPGAAPNAILEGTITDLRLGLSQAGGVNEEDLEQLRNLAQLRGLADLEEICAQLLAVLHGMWDAGVPRPLLRPINTGALAMLGTRISFESAPPSVEHLNLMNEVWPLLVEGLSASLGPDSASPGITAQTSVAPGSEPRLAWIEAAALSLGISHLAIHLAATENREVIAIDVPGPCIVLGRALLAGDGVARFLVGRALELLRRRATLLDRMDKKDLQRRMTQLAVHFGARRGGAMESSQLKLEAKHLLKKLSRYDLKSLEELAPRFAAEPVEKAFASWRERILCAANRVGLLVAGDLGGALLAMTGSATLPVEVLRQPECVDLIQFALSERYLSLRREAGLAPRGRRG